MRPPPRRVWLSTGWLACRLVNDCVGNSILPRVLCSADVVEGFSVFKGLADNNADLRSGKLDMNTRKDEDSVAVRQRKEIEREIEVIEILQCTGVGVLHDMLIPFM